jgi:amino acid transporter
MNNSVPTKNTLKGDFQGVFLRKSSGLVRQLSVVDAFFMNSIGMNIGMGAGLMFISAPYLFSGGSISLSIILATLLSAFTIAYVYSRLSAAMPRSGGDYVFVSRIISPVTGFVLSWSQTIWLFFWIGFNAWAPAAFVIPSASNIIGAVTGNEFFFNLSTMVSSRWGMIIVGSVINIVFTLVLIFASDRYWRWQKFVFFFAVLSVVISIVLFMVNGANFQQAWDMFVAKSGGLKFQEVIDKAAALGYQSKSNFSIPATLAMMPFAFWAVGYCQGSAQIGSEVKQASKTQYIAMVIAVLANGAVLLLMGLTFINSAGMEFIKSIGFMNAEHFADLGLKVQPYYTLMSSMLSNNILVIVLIGIGYVAWAINGTPQCMFQATRYMLAWSFDRVTPEKLGYVSDRYHSPVYGLVLCGVMGEVALIILTFVAQASLLSALVAQILAFMLVAIAGIIFPYKMKDVYNASVKREIFGIPLITISGIGMFLFLGLMLYYFLKYSAFGANSPVSIGICAIIIVSGIIYYYVYKAIQKKNNIDTSLAYKVIPPE